MSYQKISQDVADGAVALTGVSTAIASVLDKIINPLLTAGVAIVTIIWFVYRIEKLRHEKKQRDKNE